MTEADAQTLEAALRSAGFASAADMVRDQDLAARLEDAGHSQLATALRGDTPEPAPGGEPTEPEQPEAPESEADQFLAHIRAAQNKNTVSIPVFGDSEEAR